MILTFLFLFLDQIPGEMHVLEKEMFDHFHYSKVLPDQKIKPDANPNSNNIIHKSNGIVSSASKSESEMHVSLDAMDLIHILASKSDAVKVRFIKDSFFTNCL